MYVEFVMFFVLVVVVYVVILSVVYTGDSSVRKSFMLCIIDKYRIFKR